MSLVSLVMSLVPWAEISRTLAEVKNEDAVFVLAYSIIMLNTDLHNPQIRVSVLDPHPAIPNVYMYGRKK